jgi:cytochrome c-type biogenesis protein CcmH/NrfG
LTAIQSDPQYALAYRELGFLDEDELRYSDAAANYQQYLQLLPSTSLDRLRIKRRLAQCQSRQTGQEHP